MSEKEDTFIIGRHSEKPRSGETESFQYPGLTESGVEKARNTGKELSKQVEEMPRDGVFFIVGATREDRTKSTGRIYGEELAKNFANSEDVCVITESNLDKKGKSIDLINDVLEKTPNKKLVFCKPLYIKEFDFGQNWGFSSKEGSAYYKYLTDKYGDDEEAEVDEWLATAQNKSTEHEMFIPNPNIVAENYARGFSRIKSFIGKNITERPTVIVAVGHRWDLDAFITKNCKGEVTPENFREIIGQADEGQGLTNENEQVVLKITNDKTKVMFRGKEYIINSDEEK